MHRIVAVLDERLGESEPHRKHSRIAGTQLLTEDSNHLGQAEAVRATNGDGVGAGVRDGRDERQAWGWLYGYMKGAHLAIGFELLAPRPSRG